MLGVKSHIVMGRFEMKDFRSLSPCFDDEFVWCEPLKVICAKDGLTCYFDRPINSAVKVAGTAINNAMSPGVMPGSSTSFPWPVRSSTAPENKAGPGSFIDESMFEDLK